MQWRPRDTEILSWINRYKLLSSTAIYLATKHICRNENRFLNRLTDLKNYGVICRSSELRAEPDLHYRTRDAVYELTGAGRAVLLDSGIEPISPYWCTGPTEHDYATAASISSVELSCLGSGIQFVPPAFFAERAGAMERPFTFNDVRIKHRGKSATVEFTPDWPPFALRFPNGTFVPIIATETDRGTETNSPEDLTHASVMRHILCYDELDRSSSFVGRYKLKNRRYFVLIQTSSELRKRNMMRAIGDKIGASPVYLFKSIPKFARFTGRSAPTAELMTTPWSRIGHPDVVLSQVEG